MDDAIKKVRQHAASALVRTDKLKQELAALEAQGAPELAERIEAKRGEVAEAEAGYQEIISELRTLQEAAKASAALPVDASSSDPFTPSVEDQALDNVRRNIDELSALAELNDDLSGKSRFAGVEKANAEADARAQLAELKAKKLAAASEAAPKEGAGPPPLKKPKKTL